MRRNVYACVVVLFCFPTLLRSSSVRQVTFNELVTSSELIFDGRAVNSRAEFDSRGLIHTYITFEILDLLKGTTPGRTIVLRYQGGTVGLLTLDVSDLVPPKIGERGLYFVESPGRTLAHPLYGWDQGHFILMSSPDDGTDRVFSRTLKPIVGFEQSPGKATGLSTGVAAGLLVVESTQRNVALTVSEFKQKVLEITRQ